MIFEMSNQLMDSSGVDTSFNETKYGRQKWMIYGEGMVFGLALITGMILLYRSYKKEVHVQTSKSNFLMSITHELKTPITSIKLFLDTLSRKGNLSNDLSTINSQALDETKRLDNLVNKLLTANKLEADTEYQKELLNPFELISDRSKAFKLRYPDLEIKLEGQEDLKLTFDHLAFVSVVDNLIENAYKYSPEKKHLIINVSSLENKILFQFIDQGTGINEKIRPYIFDKFYRGVDENKRETKGTGLGLYIVKSLLEDHKGSIKHSPNKPSGSIFTISLKAS